MAPEQRDDPQRTDHRVDIYSLGVVLYELLTGELPGQILEAPSRKVQIDVRLDEIVLRALEVKPELRFATAAEFRTQVEKLASSAGGSGRAEAPPESGTNEGEKEDQRTFRPWEPPRWLLGLALAGTIFYSGMAPGAAFVTALPLRGVWIIALAMMLLVASAFLAGRILRQGNLPARCAGFAWAAFGLTLPVLGLAIFFLNALFQETGGWNPATDEALLVPLTWLGAILLPFSGHVLHRAAQAENPAAATRTTALKIANVIVGMALLFSGILVPVMITTSRNSTEQLHAQEEFQRTVALQKEWQAAHNGVSRPRPPSAVGRRNRPSSPIPQLLSTGRFRKPDWRMNSARPGSWLNFFRTGSRHETMPPVRSEQIRRLRSGRFSSSAR